MNLVLKWILAILAAAGVFYFARQLMPSATAVDAQWVYGQVKPGMGMDQVLSIAGEPAQRLKHQVGASEVWYYVDRYDERDRLAVHFIQGEVYKREVEDEQ